MEIAQQIEEYIASQAEAKGSDMRVLQQLILQTMPGCRLWYLDGRDEKGKIVSNPNIGYGLRTIQYSDGKTREFYQIGLSANTTGISVYIMGIDDKQYLTQTFGKQIGKASVTGYCIKFKTVKDINIDVLAAAIRYGAEATNTSK